MSSCGSLHGDLVAERLEAAHAAADDGFAVALVEECRTELAVGRAVAEQVVGDDENAVADRDGRALLAAPGREAVLLRREVAAPGVDRAAGHLHEGAPQPGAARSGGARAALAGRLVHPRTHVYDPQHPDEERIPHDSPQVPYDWGSRTS